MRNASVGPQRPFARLRSAQGHRSAAAVTFQRNSISIARSIRAGSVARPTLSGERLVSITAVGLVAIALILSNLGSDAPAGAIGPTGNTAGAGSEPRIALGGAVSGLENAPQGGIDDRYAAGDPGPTSDSVTDGGSLLAPGGATIDGPFTSDGTLVKPVSVDTTVTDGKALMRTYRVRSGDTLTGIANKFDVSMMTVWWANHLKAKDDLHIGQTLTIPPVSGVVVTVTAADTLETLAMKFGVEPADIIDTNQLADPNLVVGQTLTIPGARSKAISTPKPKATTKPAPSRTTSGGGGTTRPPAQYSGGKFAWPVAGGYISQYFHYGHYAIDIAADSGTRVMAAAGGTVTFAGWKNNGGGYQVWIAHGSGLYTTYNHMSSVAVGRGQHVSRGQQVGRVGMTGRASGPHLHFEVWRGPIWDGGTRVNPLIYL
ncbi:MAG: M23 family metallopeptidase [Chloroflexi bacterium]|nr:M23 family metallopeptidase [Chloroflexota bacterium]